MALYWHQRYYSMKTKNPATKYYPVSTVSIEAEPQLFGSDALLSELWRHVFFGISLNCLLFLHYLNLELTSRTSVAWPPKILTDLSSSTCLNISERRASDPNGRGLRFNTNILFSRSFVSDANIAIIANFSYFVKNLIVAWFFQAVDLTSHHNREWD